MDQMEKSSSFEELIHALEEERQKVEVFHRELPLCRHLINQTIERYKQLMVDDDNPRHQLAVKELISLRPTSSGEGRPLLHSMVVHPEKPIARRSWGNSRLLFGPFEVEHQAITDADTASGEAGDEVANGGGSQGEVKEKEKEKDKCLGKRKVRRNWSEELHRRFVLALEQLGGCHAATPKRIRKLMKVEGLTNDEIKSHLQKFRIHARRTSPVLQSGSNGDKAANFVVVRGIWIPTPAGLLEFDDAGRGEEQP